jgi:arsenate reductase (glutaredoxin)
MLEMLGIPNCDTVKKARLWLAANHIAYRFRDLRQEPLSASEWRALVDSDPTASLVNTRSPSFRQAAVPLSDLAEPEAVVALLLAQPTAMKRPAMVRDGALLGTGFDPQRFANLVS